MPTNSAYTTVQGDAWDSISKRVYGDEAHTGLLIAANPEHTETVLFSAGIVLTVPPRPELPARAGLPIWRQ